MIKDQNFKSYNASSTQVIASAAAVFSWLVSFLPRCCDTSIKKSLAQMMNIIARDLLQLMIGCKFFLITSG